MKKGPTLRERFEECYTAVPVPGHSKKKYRMKYIYYAPWYYWDLPGRRLRKEKCILIACSILSLALFLFAAVQKTELNSWKTVYLPCAIALCAHIVELVGLVQFCIAGQPTTQMTYQDVNRTMEFAPVVRGFCMVVAGIAALAGMTAEGFTPLSAGVVAALFICAAAAGVEVYRYSKIPVRKEKNTTLEKMDQAANTRDG